MKYDEGGTKILCDIIIIKIGVIMDRLFKALFMEKEIEEIKKEIEDKISRSTKIIMSDQKVVERKPLTQYVYTSLGRSDFFDIDLSQQIIDKLNYIANNWNPKKYSNVELKEIQYTEYNKDLGSNPSLSIHTDFGNESDLLIDYQLDSNTLWAIGVEEDVWELNNNDSLILNQRSYLHYRPIKDFNDKEFVKMIFFKFGSGNQSFEPVEVSSKKRERIENIYKNYYKK